LSETYRFSKRPDVADGADPLGAERTPSRIAVQVILVAFLFFVGLLLGYETYSLGNSDTAWPITWYVRCVSRLSSPATFIVAMVMCGLLGRWLWYRPLTRER